MSETLIPLAYKEMTSSSMEKTRLSCLGTTIHLCKIFYSAFSCALFICSVCEADIVAEVMCVPFSIREAYVILQ